MGAFSSGKLNASQLRLLKINIDNKVISEISFKRDYYHYYYYYVSNQRSVHLHAQ